METKQEPRRKVPAFTALEEAIDRIAQLERELAEARAYAERNAWLVVEQGKTVVAQAAVVEAARAVAEDASRRQVDWGIWAVDGSLLRGLRTALGETAGG